MSISDCVFGPKLFSIYRSDLYKNNESPDNYSMNIIEQLSDSVIRYLCMFANFMKWTPFIWGPYFYRKLKSPDSLRFYVLWSGYALSVYVLMTCIRGLGRRFNPVYMQFLADLNKARARPDSAECVEQLHQFDFDFSHWPVQYDAAHFKNGSCAFNFTASTVKRNATLPGVFRPLCYLLSHTIGVRMAFPGCTGIINGLVAQQLRTKRAELRENHKIVRVKLRTERGLEVEAFYKDNRNTDAPHSDGDGQSQSVRGSASPSRSSASSSVASSAASPSYSSNQEARRLACKLVICCEGNAGFPEMGNTRIPLELGYSVIGWNHPGFSGSTGLPFPQNDLAAMDAVIKFAVERLGFALDDVILYAWSIGGYTASWAASHYPRISGLLLDATFDNIDALAERVLPSIAYPLVLNSVRLHLDLNVKDHLIQYDGPVSFIIRSKDEVISTEGPTAKRSNRGFALIEAFLEHRYPHLFCDESRASLWQYFEADSTGKFALLSAERAEFGENALRSWITQVDLLSTTSSSSFSSSGSSCSASPQRAKLFPAPSSLLSANASSSARTSVLLFLASKYAHEFEGAHCTELPARHFASGWSERELLASSAQEKEVINKIASPPPPPL